MEEKIINNQDEFLDYIDFVKSKVNGWEEMSLEDFGNNLMSSKGSGLCLKTKKGDVFPFRETSLRSLKQRLTGGENPLVNRAFYDITGEDYILFDYILWAINAHKKYFGNPIIKVGIVDDKVNAVMSRLYMESLDEHFVHHTAFDAVLTAADETDFEFIGAWNFAGSTARYTSRKDLDVGGEKLKRVITIRTSDAGYSSIAISIGYRNADNVYIPAMSDENIVHKGRASLSDADNKRIFKEKFEEAINKAYSVLEGLSKERVEEMKKTFYEHPENVALALCDKMKKSRSDAYNVISVFDEGETKSGWDIYTTLCRFFVDDSSKLKLREEGDLAKLLDLDWSIYDVDHYAWKGGKK